MKAPFTKKQKIILRRLLATYQPLQPIAAAVHAIGGRVLLVGGAVRDILLGRAAKDLDFEVYGVEIDQLAMILKKSGPVSLVGKSFGVLKIHGHNVDFSVPRIDRAGRKPVVCLDSSMDFARAFARRDLTINAMGIDVHTHELIDPFGGCADLKAKRLRTPDARRFVEDPLRFYRVMQFVGRFALQPDDELNALCARMSLRGVSPERIEQEFAKLFLQSKRPSLGIEWVHRIGRLAELMPELAATSGVVQSVKWHPEGDVYEHTKQTLDAVARMKFSHDHERLMASWAALGHDLGKVQASQVRENGYVSAHGHEIVSVPLAKKLMRRFTRNGELIAGVCKIVRYHMAPGQLIAHHAKPSAFKRLALKLAPQVTLQLLGTFARADKLARNPEKGSPLRTGDALEKRFLVYARKLKVLEAIERPILQGRDVLDVVAPGPQMGVLLKKAYALQLNKSITDKAQLKKQIQIWLKRQASKKSV